MNGAAFDREPFLRKIPWILAALVCISLAGCNLPAGQAATTPTLNVTQAYQTVEARLTEAISRTAPVPTPTVQEVPTATLIATSTAPANQATPTASPQATGTSADNLCDQAAPGVPIDISIPDGTKLQPGEAFTKTWRLVNAGTCTWTGEYSLVWFSGEKFGASDSVPLSGSIAPGQTVDLSADMEAPENPGVYISYWKLRNPAGALFGIGPSGGAAFWVQVEVTPSTTITTSPTAGSQTTPTITPTPVIQARGTAKLEPGEALDLDTNQVNSGGEDLLYQVNDQAHVLAPQGSGVGLAWMGADEPALSACQTTNLSADPLPVDELPVGSFLCYRTNMALPGWIKLAGLEAETGELSLEINTWTVP